MKRWLTWLVAVATSILLVSGGAFAVIPIAAAMAVETVVTQVYDAGASSTTSAARRPAMTEFRACAVAFTRDDELEAEVLTLAEHSDGSGRRLEVQRALVTTDDDRRLVIPGHATSAISTPFADVTREVPGR